MRDDTMPWRVGGRTRTCVVRRPLPYPVRRSGAARRGCRLGRPSVTLMARPQTPDQLRARARTQGRPEALAARRPQPPIVEMRRVTKVYPGGHVGLENVSLRVDRGEFVFLVGPTGWGKTTLIKALV